MATTTRRPARQLAFRWHLLGLAAASLIPVVAFAVLLVDRSAHAERARIERELVMRAQLLAGALDREIAASLRALDTLARSEQLARGDLAGFRREAVRVAEEQTSWFAVVLLDPAGERIVDTLGEVGGATVDPASFDELIRTRRQVVGELVRARDGETWVFALRTPVLAGDRVRYVLSAAVSADEIGRAVAIGGPDDAEWSRTVFDRSGTVVARTRDPAPWVGRRAPAALLARARDGRDGFVRGVTIDGIPTATGLARAPLTGWTAAVSAPTAVVDAPVRRSTALLALGGATSLLLSIAGAFLLSRRFARAVGSAADAAEALAAGGPAAVTSCGIREVASLGDALATSARLLEARREEGDRYVAAAAAARRAAEDSSRAKDEFLAMLGHELRNPLSPILTALHLLRQRGGAWGREHEIITRQVGHLVRLVDDLLDVSRVTRAKIRLHPERLDLSAVVARAVEMTSPLLEERKHRLAVDVPPGLVLVGDPLRLAQVVANLLTNAARYTPAGGHVSVTGRREGDRIALEVADDGQGISPELLPRVFDLFTQGPRGPDRAEGGLGIGLALVRSLVALHGGAVEARSDGAGRGATFRVVLPAAAAPADVAPASVTLPTSPRRSAPRLSVLVVDDNADAATLLADYLARAGHAVELAHDGPAAVAAAEARRPDVLILDVGLPVMDGYEVAALLRKRLGAAAPAIVGVTGYGQERDRARSRQAGFLHHLVKPVDPAEVLAAVEDASGRAAFRAPG